MSDVTAAQIMAGDSGPQSAGGPSTDQSASLWADARRQLIRSPIFLIAGTIVVLVASMAIVPWLWTRQDPFACDVKRSRISPSGEHPFGFNVNGCDYYAHAVYGARPSLQIAVLATLGIVLIGGTLGLMAGFYGGWVDALISRVMDVFFSVPFLLGAIVFLIVIKRQNPWTLTAVLIVLAWPTIARIMRGSVISSKNLDYVQAARALGATNRRLMLRHILPNAVAPMLVYATIVLGSFVSAEATLTYLGVGLQAPAASWGVMISDHQVYFLEKPWLLLFPCGLLVCTVLSFILIGDALRDALDPRLR